MNLDMLDSKIRVELKGTLCKGLDRGYFLVSPHDQILRIRGHVPKARCRLGKFITLRGSLLFVDDVAILKV